MDCRLFSFEGLGVSPFKADSILVSVTCSAFTSSDDPDVSSSSTLIRFADRGVSGPVDRFLVVFRFTGVPLSDTGFALRGAVLASCPASGSVLTVLVESRALERVDLAIVIRPKR